MEERSFEYDSFGPWIYRIEGRHTLPPLFAGNEKSVENARMCFKIPRDIERRDANPNMNLYDAVIAVFDEHILLLERREEKGKDRVRETIIPFSRISSIRKRTCLLSGTLTLVTSERNVDIPFNAVSEEIIGTAITLIRNLIPRDELAEPVPAMPYDLKNMEIHFINAVDRMKDEDSALSLAAYQPSLKYAIPRQFKWDFLNRLGLKEQVLSGFVILGNRRELVAVHRIYYTNRPSTERYAYTTHYLPYASLNIDSVSTAGPYPGLRMKTERAQTVLPYSKDNESLKALYKLPLTR